MSRSALSLIAVMLGVLSSSASLASGAPAPDVIKHEPASVAGAGITAKLAVKPLTIDMLDGDTMGHVSLGIFCLNEQPRTVNAEFLKSYGSYAAGVMNQELKRLGYNLADRGQSNAFDADLNAAPDFRVGGIIRDVKFETCAIGQDVKGWVYFKVSWALYSEKEQKVVLERVTEGVAKSDDRIPDLMKRGLVAVIDNFLADAAFAEQIKAEYEVYKRVVTEQKLTLD